MTVYVQHSGLPEPTAVDVRADTTVEDLLTSLDLQEQSSAWFHDEELDETATLADASVGAESLIEVRPIMLVKFEKWERIDVGYPFKPAADGQTFTVRMSPDENIQDVFLKTIQLQMPKLHLDYYCHLVEHGNPTTPSISLFGLEKAKVQLVTLPGSHRPFVMPPAYPYARRSSLQRRLYHYDPTDEHSSEGLYQTANAGSVVRLELEPFRGDCRNKNNWIVAPPQGFGFYLKPRT